VDFSVLFQIFLDFVPFPLQLMAPQDPPPPPPPLPPPPPPPSLPLQTSESSPFTLKFRVVQNEKCSQTDLALLAASLDVRLARH